MLSYQHRDSCSVNRAGDSRVVTRHFGEVIQFASKHLCVSLSCCKRIKTNLYVTDIQCDWCEGS